MKKIIRKLLASALAAITVLSVATIPTPNGSLSEPIVCSAAESYSAGMYKTAHCNGSNVRKTARTGKVVGAAPEGVEFYVSKVTGNWGYTESIKTTDGTKSGWVCLDYTKKLEYGDIKISTSNFVPDILGGATVKFTFSGVGIAKIAFTTSSVAYAECTRCSWKAYPNECTAEFKIWGDTNSSVTLYLYSDSGKVIGQATARAKSTVDLYDEDAAISFAKKNAYKNYNWLCAEYATRVLKAGGIPINVIKGCTTLFGKLRELEIEGYGTIHELNVESNGSAKWSKNRDKVSEGDIIVIYCPSCIDYDGYPYVHAVIAGKEDLYSAIGVYAHNNAHSDEDIYYGFNYCSVHGACSDNKAYVFHFN